MERTLVDVGWSPFDCGPSRYADRFASTRDGTPEPVGTAVAGDDGEHEAVEQQTLAETIAGLRERGMTWHEVCRRTGVPSATAGRGILRASGRGDLIRQRGGTG